MSTLTTKERNTVRAPDGTVYDIIELLGENENFRFYGVLSEKYPNQSMILKIVTDKAKNYVLEREAFLLTEMSAEAERIDGLYAKEYDGKKLNYQIGFPKLIDNFVSSEQDDRRILTLQLTMNESLSEIVPINMIRDVDKARVDPKTSVWILGKMLKIIAFAHDQLYSTVGNLDSENIFIVKDNHLVAIFDWSQAIIHTSSLSQKTAMDELRKAVKSVILLLGGDPETGTIPDHEQLEGEGVRYRELLKSLLTNDFASVYDAHHHFYEAVEEIWERRYHPFSTVPIEN